MYAVSLQVVVTSGSTSASITPALSAPPGMGDGLLVLGQWCELAGGTTNSVTFASPYSGSSGTRYAILVRFASGIHSPAFAANLAHSMAKFGQKLGQELFEFFTSPNLIPDSLPIKDYTAAENTLVSVSPASYIQSIYPIVSRTFIGDGIPKSDRLGEIDLNWFDSDDFRIADLLPKPKATSSPTYRYRDVVQPAAGAGVTPVVVVDYATLGNFQRIYAKQPTIDLLLPEPILPTLHKSRALTVQLLIIHASPCAITISTSDVDGEVKVGSVYAARLADTSISTGATLVTLQWVHGDNAASATWVLQEMTPRYSLPAALTGYALMVTQDGGVFFPVSTPNPDMIDPLGGPANPVTYPSGYVQTTDYYSVKAINADGSVDPGLPYSNADQKVVFTISPSWGIEGW